MPRRAAVNIKLVLALAALIVATIVAVGGLFLSWISTPLGLTADQIDPTEVGELRIQLLNRPDRQDDIGPVFVNANDFDALLAPLRNAEPLDEKPGMPFLGEYQIRFKDGRRLTIRLRWERRPAADTRPALGAAVGGGLSRVGAWVPPTDGSVVWFVIEDRIYRAGKLADLLHIAEACAARAES